MTIPIAFSWSGGKDSAFALWALLKDARYTVRALLTTLNQDYRRVSMSGIREELVDRQALALGLPIIKVWVPAECTNEQYENLMASTLSSDAFEGIDHVAFADLFLADLRAHREDRLRTVNRHGIFPLWAKDTASLAHEMIECGFEAIVVTVDPRALDPSFAGRTFDERLLADLPAGVDPCGENGEFQTFAKDGPLFNTPIPCRLGEVVHRAGFVYCDVIPE